MVRGWQGQRQAQAGEEGTGREVLEYIPREDREAGGIDEVFALWTCKIKSRR